MSGQSRFTRVQRLSCFMLLLMLAMLASAMWYGTVPSSHSSANEIKMGPFAVGMEQAGLEIYLIALADFTESEL